MYHIKRADRQNGPVMEQHSKTQNSGTQLEYLTFPMLDATGLVKNLFSTRLGGVSEGIFSSMNLGYGRGDDDSNVLENFRRVGEVLEITPDQMVRSSQTHTTNIKIVTAADKGIGITRPNEETDIDGMITQEKGLALVTSYADCVPLYFVDPVNQAIGLAHSGWRGTVGRMGAHMVEHMKELYGTRPEELYAAIGPSICQECYEVSEDVAEHFIKLEKEKQDALQILRVSGIYDGATNFRVVVPGKAPGKYQLDLWLANAVILVDAGIRPERLSITDICTCHNPDYLFSHRASQGKRGGLCAFLMLKES